MLGTPISAIRDTEDRELFKRRLAEIGVKVPRSIACHTREQARKAVNEIGLPVMLRGAFALGGRGSAVVTESSEIEPALKRAFDGGIKQVLVEEYLGGWKEIEYEVVRDGSDNCITVCNMENFDPMGIHTGESIVVAPTQTLNDEEYQLLRTIAHQDRPAPGHRRRVQHPVRARSDRAPTTASSRSTPASPARAPWPARRPATRSPTSPPSWRWASRCPRSRTAITKKTTAFFEPALDYIVCKFPRWDLGKFRGASTRIGSEMKSVGEVMAIGRRSRGHPKGGADA